MTDYLFRPEVVRTALIVGVVVSIVFYERVQLTTGGAIVPAYLAVFLPAPMHVLTTLGAAYGTYVVVNRVIGRRVILYGRRKFEVEVLVGLALVTIGTALAVALGDTDPTLVGLAGIGFLVPGVIAHDMFRQRPRRTLLAMGITTAIVAAFVFVYESLLDIAPIAVASTELPALLSASFPVDLMLGAVIASVLVGMLVFWQLGLRSGGFITGAYLAFVLVRPLDVIFAGAVALATWAVVTKVLMPRLLIFGRRKLSTMVLVGAILAWAAELVVIELTGYTPWAGLTVMTLMVPALLANDAQRQGVARTTVGALLTSVGVFGIMNVATAIALRLDLLPA